jgi:hypothetical protein
MLLLNFMAHVGLGDWILDGCVLYLSQTFLGSFRPVTLSIYRAVHRLYVVEAIDSYAVLGNRSYDLITFDIVLGLRYLDVAGHLLRCRVVTRPAALVSHINVVICN